ncbi:hypothetical protein H1P_2070005 [Hyella patelloides LEGE 07179]|uniref:Uncharacterized protein n=1 Tax=Hyella patelloides LEGE 07179 TaxID=945734 RepID=A0A563VQE9_9CYAN|nr:hypothetical protein H1P_2070005 [Hyella patelloides LEGE 07179]
MQREELCSQQFNKTLTIWGLNKIISAKSSPHLERSRLKSESIKNI